MTLLRRQFIRLGAGAAAATALPRPLRAQSYPTRPITVVVFVPPGAVPDIVGRLLGESLAKRLGQPVVIENRPGAGGNLALQAVALAPADGHTLLMLASPHAVNVTLYPNSRVSVTKDIAPVATLDVDTFVLLVNPAFGPKTVAEFIAYAKANPGKINLSSNGTGNLTHLAGELFKTATGIDTLHVPYRGTPAAFAALTAGDIHALFDTVGGARTLIEGGKLRALGVTSAKRVAALPNVPAIAETVPGYTVLGWLGIGAPKDTPPAIVERLNKEINAVLEEPAIKARMADLGSDPFASTPAEFSKFIAEDVDKWAKVVKTAGLKIE